MNLNNNLSKNYKNITFSSNTNIRDEEQIHFNSDYREISNIEKIIAIIQKNLIIKLRNYQTYIYSFGFPIIFTLLFYFIFGTIEIENGLRVFDISYGGMLIYTASFGTINAATSLTEEKQVGTLNRLDATPIGRPNIFISTILSEAVFLLFQLIVMYIIGYLIMGLKWYNMDFVRLFFGFSVIFIFGLSTLGIGVIISAFAKSADSAVGISLVYVMPIIFLSGSMIPFESPIQYFMPPFWAYALYRQYVVLGYDFWNDSVQISSTNPFVQEYLPIPLFGGFLIIIFFLLITILIGIRLFQLKTTN